jgi:glucose-6-phosphate dehydrogenase assembly protein OpcA
VIVDLPSTTTKDISKRLVRLRQDVGSMALSRVLTLVLVVDEQHAEAAIQVANDASHQHPCRIVAVVTGNKRGASRLDAQIRVGGDAGASEVIVLRAYGETASDEEGLVTALLLPDAPVVVWWPGTAPDVVSTSPLGRIATCRITDSSAAGDPHEALLHLAETYAPGDTDFAWTRLTLWRAQLAAALDQPPYEPVDSVEVSGAPDSPSTVLLAAWLRLQLDAPVQHDLTARQRGLSGIHGVQLHRASGTIELVRDMPDVATLRQPGEPTHDLALPRRNLRDCLAEELRRLDPDELYGKVLTQGLPLLESEEREAAIR